MHSEFVAGLTIRPLMDAGYTAWRDGQRVGIVRLLDGSIVVDAADRGVERVLVDRLAADLRLLRLPVCVSSSREQPERSDGRSSGSFWQRDTKSAA
jgi:hypothetical protein